MSDLREYSKDYDEVFSNPPIEGFDPDEIEVSREDWLDFLDGMNASVSSEYEGFYYPEDYDAYDIDLDGYLKAVESLNEEEDDFYGDFADTIEYGDIYDMNPLIDN